MLLLSIFLIVFLATLIGHNKTILREQAKHDVDVYDMILSDLEPQLSDLLIYAPQIFQDFVTNNIKNFVLHDDIMRNQFLKMHVLMAGDTTHDVKTQQVVTILIIFYNGFIQNHLYMKNDFDKFLSNLYKTDKYTANMISTLVYKEYLPDNFKIPKNIQTPPQKTNNRLSKDNKETMKDVLQEIQRLNNNTKTDNKLKRQKNIYYFDDDDD